MTIKLSEKGLGKLYNSKACYYDPDTEEEVVALSYFEHVFEFEPDDFQGAVVLTLEEAKDILHSLNCAWSRCPVKAECKDLIKKKIKQAEGYIPINNASVMEGKLILPEQTEGK